MKRIAIFISHYTIDNNTSIINLLDWLSDNCEIWLFLSKVFLINNKVLHKQNIHIIHNQKFYLTNCLLHPTTYGKNQLALFRSKKMKFEQYICIDPNGFLLCKSLFPFAQPFYYSLELYLSTDHAKLTYPKNVLDTERKHSLSIKGLVIQSKERGIYWKKDYKLPIEFPTFYLPVTLSGKSQTQKSDYLYKKYKLPKSTKIAIHTGGVSDFYPCRDFSLIFSRLKNWVLFFQGYQDQKYVQSLNKYLIRHNINNTIITDEIFDNVNDVDNIVRSCHIGIAWYPNFGLNFSTAGYSSGKISTYLKYGLPVITNNYPSFKQVIADSNSGVCLPSISQFSAAVKTIETDYDRYSKNARKQFDQVFSFDNYKKDLLNFLELDK